MATSTPSRPPASSCGASGTLRLTYSRQLRLFLFLCNQSMLPQLTCVWNVRHHHLVLHHVVCLFPWSSSLSTFPSPRVVSARICAQPSLGVASVNEMLTSSPAQAPNLHTCANLTHQGRPKSQTAAMILSERINELAGTK